MSNNEILREFLLETHENLALLDSDLVKLETNPSDVATLSQVFRTLHSVKGTAGFMGLVKLQAIAHSAESLLSRIRAGHLSYTPTIATALLRVVDAIREILANIETSAGEGTGDYSALAAEVDRLRDEGIHTFSPPTEPAKTGVESTIDFSPAMGVVPVSTLPIPPPPSQVATVQSAPTLPTSEATESRAATVADAAIRVDVGLLDKLMTLMGELVLARNQILQHSESLQDDHYLSAVQRLNSLTTELQASVMKTRMQPIGNVLNKFPRVVRDLSVACGKKVRFEMDGQDTELDKTLIEAIRDPLTHMIRNSIDHGIETPDVRRSHGKSEEGRLRMVAYHEGGKVIVELIDDGAGIDADKVREKAIHAKLVTPEIAARMTRQELLRLVFLPGFSTADRVTQFSGRGVGMDVVRTNIERIGGSVDLESTAGVGTTVRTKIPLTLAIIPALIVISGGERFAIPQVSLLELVRLDPQQTQQGIERLHDVPVYRLRGALLPLVFLDEQLQLEPQRPEEDALNIVVLQADDQPFGLVVDAIRDTAEIVVKPLQKQIKSIPVFAGAAIMGDGRIALVLDVVGLAQRANVITGAKRRALAEVETSPEPTLENAQSFLLFVPRAGGQMAIPLSSVSRLDEVPSSMIEKIGPRQVLQYRGQILPLVDVSHEMDRLSRALAPSNYNASEPIPDDVEFSNATIPIVVYSDGGHRVGLIVGKILDIVHCDITARFAASRPGTLFTSIVHDRVTEFVDFPAIVRQITENQMQPAR